VPFTFSINYVSNIDNATSIVNFVSGTISNCEVNFAGVTRETGSNATISFIAPSPINSSSYVLFKILYGGAYVNYDLSMVSGNGSCQLFLSPDTTGIPSATCDLTKGTGAGSFQCKCNNASLQSNSTVTLRLTPVNNPPVTNNYLNYNLSVQTSDNSSFVYDSTQSCNLNSVSPETHTGTVSTVNGSSYKINTNYLSPVVTTSGNVSSNFNSGDFIQIVANGGITFSYGVTMSVSQSVSLNYTVQNSSSSNTSILTKNNKNSDLIT
jgi:hypothetical protein